MYCICLSKGDLVCTDQFNRLASNRQTSINEMLWSSKHLSWFDTKNSSLNDKYFYASNLAPLSSGIEPPAGIKPEQVIEKHRSILLKYATGVPVSLVNSSQQWDFPYVWSPNQHTLIMMLMKYDGNMASILTKRFFSTVYNNFLNTNTIADRYSVLDNTGQSNREFQNQPSYLSTIGVCLDLINIYKDEIITEN
jgi:alpha,alpha-trehalase